MYSIGVDLGGTKILTALIHESGNIEQTVELATEAERGPDAVIERIEKSIEDVRGAVLDSEIRGIGIGAPGPLNPKTGVVLSPPNLPGWHHIPLRDLIRNRFNLPTFLENDANAAALAEHRFGSGENVDNMVYVTVSTGIGAGLIFGGHLYHGTGGSAGEIGHISIDAHGRPCVCGNRGCLEVLASGTAIARIAEEAYGRPLNAREISDMAAAGDAKARGILRDAFSYLGLGLINIVNLFNPSKIVIGGGVSQVDDEYFEHMTAMVQASAFPTAAAEVEIVRAKLGRNSGVIGGAVLPFIANHPEYHPV